MPRALMLALLGLQATPARYTLEAVALRATAPVPDQQLELALRLDGRPLGEATLLYGDGRAHLALKGPLGARGPVLRVADGMLGLQLGPEREVVAADAAVAVRELLGGVPLDALVDLLVGRAPAGRWSSPDGQPVVRAGAVWARVDREGALQEARVGGLHVRYGGEGVELTRGGRVLQVRVQARTVRAIPERAFTHGTAAQVQLLAGR